jgi:chemotaxis protein MotD
VASKASVQQSQQAGSNRRERMPEAEAPPSPFSMFLSETESRPARTPQESTRTQSTTSAHRSDAARTTRSNRDRTADTSEPETTEAAANEQPEGAETNQPATAAPEQEIIEALTMPAEGGGGAPSDEAVPSSEAATTDAIPAVAMETPLPATPEQPAVATDTLSVDAAPAPVPIADASGEAGAEQPATAPTGDIAAVAPESAGGTAPQTTPAPIEPTGGIAHEGAAPATPPRAKPVVASNTTTDTADSLAPAPTDDTLSAVVSATGGEQSEIKPSPQRPSQAEPPSHASAHPQAPEPAERPQTASAVSEFVQASHPTPDSNQLAHLQTGRDFGQMAATSAQVSQSADASNPLVSAPVPLESLAVEITSRAQGGRNRFEIRLDPPELGRIEVRLDIDRSGNVTSRLVVEKTETLDVLRRDAHQLERALQDAGLKTSDNSLQFSLRDQSFSQRNDQDGSARQSTRIADPEAPIVEGAPLAYGLTLRGGSGVDIRV